MIYVIENKIVFNPEDNTLSLQDDINSQVAISNPARRILLLLIEHHGTVVQRDTIFKKVWDDFGLVSSNNNLNHCISKLRKVINTLGHSEEVIITVPKVGFLLKKEIVISTRESPISSSITDHQVTPEPPGINTETVCLEKPLFSSLYQEKEAELPSSPVKETRKGATRNHLNLLISIFSFALFLLAFAIILRDHFYDPKDRLQITMLGDCPLYSTSIIPASQKPNFIHLARHFIDKNKIKCNSGDIFIFQSESVFSMIKTGASREFLAQCRVNKNNDADACLSVYINNRKDNDKR